MLDLMRKRLPWLHVAALGTVLAAIVALYCIGYSAFAGHPESLGESLAWSMVNILPWLPALEGAKRARSLRGVVLALVAGLAGSLLLGFAFAGSTANAAFELWRRVPALTLVAAVTAAMRWGNRGQVSIEPGELPLSPHHIDWVRAAGNYVELRGCGRTVVHRASLSSVELQLRCDGFVRIHRSMLVRRERIARVRPADVVLVDGTHLKIGKRYRAALAA